MSIKDDLQKVKELIADPQHWTQGHMAADKENSQVATYSDRACRFCMLGALFRLELYDSPVIKHLEKVLMRKVNHSDIAAFNDSSTHAEVMMMLDIAIKEAA